MNLKLNLEELFELIEDSERIRTAPWKWGTRETYVCARDGKQYEFTVECHSQEGVQHYGSIDLTEVRKVEKTVTVWEPVT